MGKTMHNPEIVKEEFLKVGLTMLDVYSGLHKNIKCVNEDGYIIYTKYRAIRNKELNFKIFHPLNPYTIENIKHYIKSNKINVTLLSEQYINAHEKLKFKCECGRIFKTCWSSFKYQNKYRCDVCSKNKPLGEVKVEEWLKNNDIKYIPQYKSIKLRYKYPLSFDFAILGKNDKIIAFVEVDGIQHFQPIERFGGEKRFIEQKLIDEIKNNFAIDENIRMIRIPYWEIKNNTYINKLKTLI